MASLHSGLNSSCSQFGSAKTFSSTKSNLMISNFYC